MSITCFDSDGNVLKALYQWDNNQTLTVQGLDMPPIPVFHFCNRLSNLALVVTPTVSGTSVTVNIPNILLQQAEPIIAYVYQDTENDGYRTMHAIHIPVIPRPKPDDYEYTDNVDYISVAVLNSRLNTLMQQITGDSQTSPTPEVVDIRIGYDGTIYGSAGDAVRAIGHALNDLEEQLIEYTVPPWRIQGTKFLNEYDNVFGAANYRPNSRYDSVTTHSFIDDSAYWSSYNIPLRGGRTYTMSFRPYVLVMLDAAGNYIGRLTFNNPSKSPFSFTIPSEYDTVYCVFSIRSSTIAAGSNVSIVEGDTAAPVDAPHKATLDWLYYDVMHGLIVSEENIKDGAVTEQKIADGAVTAAKFADGSVTADKTDFITTDIINLFNKQTASLNSTIKSYNPDKGSVISSSGYFASDFMSVDYGETYYGYSLNNGFKISGVGALYSIAEYDQNHEFVAIGTFTNHEVSSKKIEYTPSAESVKYVRISAKMTNIDTVNFVKVFSLFMATNRQYLDGIAPTIEGHHVGKLYVSLGDSITRGCSNGETLEDGTVLPNGGQIPYPYGKYAAKLMGTEYVNFGVDGATVGTVIARIKSQDYLAGLPAVPDIITVKIGTNDMAQVPLGTPDDVYDSANLTYYGGLKEIARLLSEGYVGTTIVFITPLRADASKRTYIEAMHYVADLFDIPCMDMHKVLRYMQRDSEGNYYINDYYNGLHPNQAGHYRMGKALAGFLQTV